LHLMCDCVYIYPRQWAVASSVEGGEGGGQRKQGQRKQSSRAKASVSMMGPLPLRRRRVGVLFLALVLLGGGGADAGTTSSYRRKLEATVEMPLDADVFRVPPGYNAPQQVPDSLPAAVVPGHSRRMPPFSPFFFSATDGWMDGLGMRRCTSRWATRRARP
jgi:hypothetical protein